MKQIVLTFDIDWAPDFVIDSVAKQLIDYGIRATWFVTHHSPAIERLRQQPELFELGIHPNFLPNSTQGATSEAVLNYCIDLVNDAISMRTHGLVQSTPLLERILTQTPIKADVSLFLPHLLNLQPIEYWWHGRMLLRIPYFWEDDFEMERPAPCWCPASLLEAGEGLKVFDFHPIHIYLNSANTNAYQAFKQCSPDISQATAHQLDKFIQPGEGTQTFFMELIEYLTRADQALCIRDIIDRKHSRES